jgi:hypothetical protein
VEVTADVLRGVFLNIDTADETIVFVPILRHELENVNAGHGRVMKATVEFRRVHFRHGQPVAMVVHFRKEFELEKTAESLRIATAHTVSTIKATNRKREGERARERGRD